MLVFLFLKSVVPQPPTSLRPEASIYLLAALSPVSRRQLVVAAGSGSSLSQTKILFLLLYNNQQASSASLFIFSAYCYHGPWCWCFYCPCRSSIYLSQSILHTLFRFFYVSHGLRPKARYFWFLIVFIYAYIKMPILLTFNTNNWLFCCIVRQKVQQFLNAACTGNLNLLKSRLTLSLLFYLLFWTAKMLSWIEFFSNPSLYLEIYEFYFGFYLDFASE